MYFKHIVQAHHNIFRHLVCTCSQQQARADEEKWPHKEHSHIYLAMILKSRLSYYCLMSLKMDVCMLSLKMLLKMYPCWRHNILGFFHWTCYYPAGSLQTYVIISRKYISLISTRLYTKWSKKNLKGHKSLWFASKYCWWFWLFPMMISFRKNNTTLQKKALGATSPNFLAQKKHLYVKHCMLWDHSPDILKLVYSHIQIYDGTGRFLHHLA